MYLRVLMYRNALVVRVTQEELGASSPSHAWMLVNEVHSNQNRVCHILNSKYDVPKKIKNFLETSILKLRVQPNSTLIYSYFYSDLDPIWRTLMDCIVIVIVYANLEVANEHPNKLISVVLSFLAPVLTYLCIEKPAWVKAHCCGIRNPVSFFTGSHRNGNVVEWWSKSLKSYLAFKSLDKSKDIYYFVPPTHCNSQMVDQWSLPQNQISRLKCSRLRILTFSFLKHGLS